MFRRGLERLSGRQSRARSTDPPAEREVDHRTDPGDYMGYREAQDYDSMHEPEGFDRVRDETAQQMLYLPAPVTWMRVPRDQPLQDMRQVRPENVAFVDRRSQAEHKAAFFKQAAERAPAGRQRAEAYRKLAVAEEELDEVLTEEELRRQLRAMEMQQARERQHGSRWSAPQLPPPPAPSAPPMMEAFPRPIVTAVQTVSATTTTVTQARTTTVMANPGNLFATGIQASVSRPGYETPGSRSDHRREAPNLEMDMAPRELPRDRQVKERSSLIDPPVFMEEERPPTAEEVKDLPAAPVNVVEALRKFEKVLKKTPVFKASLGSRKDDHLLQYVGAIKNLRKILRNWDQRIFVEVLAFNFGDQSDLVDMWEERGSQVHTIAQLISLLQERYGDRTPLATRKANLLTLAMTQEEVDGGAYRLFMSRVLREVKLCHPARNEGDNRDQALDIFLNRCAPESIREKVWEEAANTTDPDRIAQVAENAFAFKKDSQLRKEQASGEPRLVGAVTTRGQGKKNDGYQKPVDQAGPENQGSGSAGQGQPRGKGQRGRWSGPGKGRGRQQGSSGHWHSGSQVITAWRCGPCDCLHEMNYRCPHSQPPPIICDYCKVPGHIARDCFKRKRKQQQAPGQGQQGQGQNQGQGQSKN